LPTSTKAQAKKRTKGVNDKIQDTETSCGQDLDEKSDIINFCSLDSKTTSVIREWSYKQIPTLDWLNNLWSNWTSSLAAPVLGRPSAIFSLTSRSRSFCSRFLHHTANQQRSDHWTFV